MQAGDIIFVQGNTLISKAIRFFDPGKFTHVCIAVSDTHILEAQRGIRTSIVPFHYADLYHEILDMGFTANERDTIVHLGIELTGRKYDYLQLVWYVLERIFKFHRRNSLNSPKDEICSEVIDTLLYELGWIPRKTFLYGRTPNQLYRALKEIQRPRIERGLIS